jgi:uncharacterized membrane protein YkvA (DUF1232 family)
MAALAYFVIPADLVPDILAGIGFSDDATVLFLAVQAIAPHIRSEHFAAAQRFFDSEASSRQAG